MEWRNHLTDDERERLKEIEQQRDDLTAEHRRIYDRCRKRSQKTLDAVEFTTVRGDTFIVDRDDAAVVAACRWFSVAPYDPTGRPRTPYIQGNVNGRRTYLHRFLTNAPKGTHVDHIDGDPLNNCRSNLRIVTPSENGKMGFARRSEAGL